MDFIKKHYEKILLAAVLMILIGSAAFLAYKATKLSEEVREAPYRPKPKGKLAQSGNITAYTNAIASLQSPPLWQDDSVIDLFSTVERTISEGTKIPIPPTKDAVILLRVDRQPFELIFKSYTGKGGNFQVDFVTRRRTFIIEKVGDEVADKFKDTGYAITKFEQKWNAAYNASLGVTNQIDVSELTIARGATEVFVLPLNQRVLQKEPVAHAQCADGTSLQPLSRAQEFSCGGKTYIVVDITSTQLIIMDKLSEEKHTIGLAAVGK